MTERPSARRGPGAQGGPGGRGGQSRSGGPRPRSRRPKGSDPSREVAFATLRAVGEDDAYANLVLPVRIRRAGLTGRDAAFATELTYGTLRLQGRHDALIARLSGRGIDQLDPPVLDILRLGVHQLTAMRVPPHAAVGESVALARAHVGAGAGGLVNAVLRRASEHPWQEWRETVLPEGAADDVERLSIEHSHPVWIVRALRAALAERRPEVEASADLVALLEADNEPATPVLVARPGLVDDATLEGLGAEPLPLAPTAWRAPAGDPGSLALVRAGVVAVQDPGSQVLPLALADVALDPSGSGAAREQWLDLCAGPGGKAGLLAALALRHGATLRAVEVAPHRADLVRQNVQAAIEAGAEVEVEVADGRTLGERDAGVYDRVLVDAPCTGLGALRRRPESRWRRRAADLTTLGPLQRDLLDSAIRATRAGGVVAYATCSPHPAETGFVVRDVLRRHPHAEVIDAGPHLRDRAGEPIADLGPGPYAQLWPHVHGTDAMFLALIRVGERTD